VSLCANGFRHPKGTQTLECDVCRKASAKRMQHWKAQEYKLCSVPCAICDAHTAALARERETVERTKI